jgi:3-dehydroquinate synthase
VIRIEVAIPGRPYDVVVGSELLDRADEFLPELPGAEKAFVVSDQVVAGLYLERLSAALSRRGLTSVSLHIPQGEEAKSLQVAEIVYRQLALREMHRGDVLVALGGGVTGDLTGFVAATYMRGLPVIQVPTTLVAHVDAAIGGKTAVNLPEGKNLVGAFHQPVAVLADVGTLSTLPDREFRSGLAEVAKYGLAVDPSILETLEGRIDGVRARDPSVLEDLVAACVRAKAATVVADERDDGTRLTLNYGHTLGHALERVEAYAGRSHGEAVAVGMVFAARLSETLGIAEPGLAALHQRLLKGLGLDDNGPAPDPELVLDAMRLDKKYRSGIRFVLLESVGRARIVEDVPEATVRETLEGL